MLGQPWLSIAPRGNGQPVIVMPGLAAGDFRLHRCADTCAGSATTPMAGGSGVNVGPTRTRWSASDGGGVGVEFRPTRRWSGGASVVYSRDLWLGKSRIWFPKSSRWDRRSAIAIGNRGALT